MVQKSQGQPPGMVRLNPLNKGMANYRSLKWWVFPGFLVAINRACLMKFKPPSDACHPNFGSEFSKGIWKPQSFRKIQVQVIQSDLFIP